MTEAFDARGHAFGLEGLRDVVADTPAGALHALPARLVEAIERFAAGGGPRDDLALLAVEYRPADVEVGCVHGESWRLSIGTAPEEAARASRRIEAILRGRDVSAPTVHDCALAAREVLASIAKYAWGDGETATGVEVRLSAEEIQIRFEVLGPPCRPRVEHLVDRCEYAREEHANVLTVRRPRPAEGPGAAATPVA